MRTESYQLPEAADSFLRQLNVSLQRQPASAKRPLAVQHVPIKFWLHLTINWCSNREPMLVYDSQFSYFAGNPFS